MPRTFQKQQPNNKRDTEKCQEHQKQPKLVENGQKPPLTHREQQKTNANHQDLPSWVVGRFVPICWIRNTNNKNKRKPLAITTSNDNEPITMLLYILCLYLTLLFQCF